MRVYRQYSLTSDIILLGYCKLSFFGTTTNINSKTTYYKIFTIFKTFVIRLKITRILFISFIIYIFISCNTFLA